MPSIRSLKRWPPIMVLTAFTGLAWSGQYKPPDPPPQSIPEGNANPQTPAVVNRPVPQQPRPAARPVVRPGVQQGVQPRGQLGRGTGVRPAVQPATQLGRGTGIQPDVQSRAQMRGRGAIQPGVQPGTQMNARRGIQPGPQLGVSASTQRGNPMGGPRSRTVQNLQFRGGGRGQVVFRPNHSLAAIRTNGMNIDHGLHGTRKIVAERSGLTFVATGRHEGYVERPYLNRGGHIYYQRTYVAGGRTYARVYRTYNYHGVRYCGYVPDHYYHPGFYAWAASRWSRPAHYAPEAWGWAGAPWFGAYGGYFRPYPEYRAPAFWLTDYVVAANLQFGFQARVEAGQPAAGGGADQPSPDGEVEESNETPMSPQVKQQIANEVQQQLTEEQAEASSPGANPQAGPGGEQVPDALNSSQRVFIVASDIDTALPTGQECGLSGGDVVMRLNDQPDANQNVSANVLSSKQGNCASGQTVAVSVQDLQEMHNQFREQIDSGLQTLAEKGGDGSLPQPPDTGTMVGEVPPPAPDAGAANQLQAEQRQADQIEGQVPQSDPSTM
jgi:hypothetical protein